MPLINGYKYSCQPCIRGHRATSCNHTDRVLIEVRKPGRPLESCGHRLDTCSCGRLQDIFSIRGAPPTQQISQNQDLRAAPRSQIPSPILHPRSKSTSSSTSKISKRATKKKALPSPTTESTSSKSPSPTPTTSPPPQNSYSFSPINLPQPQSQIPQTQIWASTPLHPGSGQPASSPFTPYQPSRRVLPSHNPSTPYSNNANETYSVASNSQSVVEDLRMVPNPNTPGQQGQVYSRSQFTGSGSGFAESRR